MIRFFREKAAIFGWAVVILFGVTMFAGTFFLDDLFPSGETAPVINPAQEVAVMGSVPVDRRKYMEYLVSYLEQYHQSRPYERLTPELREVLQLNAFQQAQRYSIFLNAAKEEKINVSKAELDQMLQLAYRQLNVADNKALKAFLEERGYTYAQFIQDQKHDIMVRKFIENMFDKVTVTDADVENLYSRLKVQHLLVRADDTNDAVKKADIERIRKEIEGGLPFEKAVQQYSEDEGSKASAGMIGWIQMNQTLPEFEDEAFSLAINELSDPVRTLYGYHLLRVTEREPLEKPAEFDANRDKELLRQARQSRVLEQFVQKFLAANALEVFDPSLKAVVAKFELNYEGAVYAYQAQISEDPGNPMPHYLLAKLHLMMEDTEKAESELKKAQIKAEMNAAMDFPWLHIELGNLTAREIYAGNQLAEPVLKAIKANYERALRESTTQRQPEIHVAVLRELAKRGAEASLAKIRPYYEKAFQLADEDLLVLKELATLFNAMNDKTNLKKVEESIQVIEAKQASENVSAVPASAAGTK